MYSHTIPDVKDNYLITVRRRQRLTQDQVAELAGTTQATISRLEKDPHAEPSFKIQTAIADALGVDPRSLRFGPDPKGAR